MRVARRFFVAGRVQGVFYRASARAKALELGLAGFAKNLSDGRVEVFAVGDASDVETLSKWLWQGSPTSHVTDIVVSEAPMEETAEALNRFLCL